MMLLLNNYRKANRLMNNGDLSGDFIEIILKHTFIDSFEIKLVSFKRFLKI